MATWLGDNCHPAGNPTVTPIDNAGPLKGSGKGHSVAGAAPHSDPNLVIAGCGELRLLMSVLGSFLQSATVLVT